ncbi:MAG: NEW3 domain-containing protein [Symbiobacterium sp.]|uniref:NEW3 domain-containing protein n=1 Tax=Symbiobacterium sp. TaxID=1971213 RepID=UPI0034649706
MSVGRLGALGKRLIAVVLSWVLLVGAALTVQPQQASAAERATVALWNALVPLESVNTFMNTGAHPDDERSAVLAYMSRKVGARTISVIANRGEGGQNAIGAEYEHALGVVRTRELQEAAEASDVELYFLAQELGDPIWDFGFSKNPEETLEKWGYERTLERLIRIIRETRPDVVLPSFQNTYGQHGHHRAITILTLEAFEKAADPEVFPEHLAEGLRPWQIKKVYLPASGGGGSIYGQGQQLTANVSIPVGEYDPVLGASYVQLGEESRFYHKSQGMGEIVPEGPRSEVYHLAASAVPVKSQESSMFDGLPQTVGDLAGLVSDRSVASALQELQAHIDAALDAYPDNAAVARALRDALVSVRAARELVVSRIGLEDELGYDIDYRLAMKEKQIQRALAQSLLLVTRLQADEYELTRGGTATLTLTAYQGGKVPVENVRLSLEVPRGWRVRPVTEAAGVHLSYNQTATARFAVTVPESAEYFDPYDPHDITGVVRFTVDGVEAAVTVAPERFVAVLPDVSLRTDPEGVVFNLERPGPITINVVVTNNEAGATSTNIFPVLPEGWQTTPTFRNLTFSRKGEVQAASFVVTAPADLAAGRYQIGFQARGQSVSDRSVQVIEYEHIGRTYIVKPAVVDVQAFSVKVDENLPVGYVSGGADNVPAALRLMGVNVELLDADTLAFGDLSVYDTIVLGIRAYLTRPDLIAANNRLMEYVRNGGNLVVQYHQPGDNWNPETSAPYYLRIGSPSFNWRVTDEAAEVRVLEPDHPLLNTPNKIEASDWEGWVKDRGLYFPSEWAPEFTPLLSMNDPGEEPLNGSLLVAEYGKGRYIYTSLILYYQLDQRVPGAFRIFANLITPAK